MNVIKDYHDEDDDSDAGEEEAGKDEAGESAGKGNDYVTLKGQCK
jgi:hypothetical protein